MRTAPSLIPSGTALATASFCKELHSAPREKNTTTQAPMPANVTADSSVYHTKIAFFQTEGPDTHWETLPSNVWGLYERVFGPQEVNLEAYTTFMATRESLLSPRRTSGNCR